MFRNLSPTVRNLIFINIAVFILGGFIPDELLSLHYFQAKDFHVFQLVTYMFSHASLMHLIGNMFGLFMFGSLLERIWGAQRFLFFYFFCSAAYSLITILVCA